MPMSAREVRQALHELGDLRYAAGDLDEALRRIVSAIWFRAALVAL